MTSSLLARQYHCWRNARRFGLFFLRNRWFSLPSRVRIGGGQVELSYPREHGIPVDFIACVIRND